MRRRRARSKAASTAATAAAVVLAAAAVVVAAATAMVVPAVDGAVADGAMAVAAAAGRRAAGEATTVAPGRRRASSHGVGGTEARPWGTQRAMERSRGVCWRLRGGSGAVGSSWFSVLRRLCSFLPVGLSVVLPSLASVCFQFSCGSGLLLLLLSPLTLLPLLL